MISFIYKTLEYFITQRVPEIKYVSLYNNQFNNIEINRPINYPAVLIEILPIQFNDLLHNVQYSPVSVNIHLGTEIYNSFDRGDNNQTRSFEHLSLLDKLYIGLNRANSELLPDELKNELYIQGGFKRTGLRLNSYNTTINQSIITGNFIFFDNSAITRYNTIELEDINLTTHFYPVPPLNGN